MPTFIASDGFEYEDIVQKFLGNKADTLRNYHIKTNTGCYNSEETEVFIKGYDSNRVCWFPIYWFECAIERGWLRVGQGRDAVVNYWASQP